MKQITLVLGSGGARGLCFVGAIKAIAASGIPIGRVIGTSMGAIVGASFCSGTPLSELEEIASKLRLKDFLSIDLFSSSLMSHRGVERVGGKLVRARTFEELKTPLSVACTDLEQGQQVIFESGPLMPAVVGSCLAAGVFEPVRHQGHVLVDGGYTDPLPVSLAKPGDVVVAIDANVPPNWKVGVTTDRRWRHVLKLPTVWRQVLKSMDTLVYSLAVQRAANSSFVHVAPDLTNVSFIDFRHGKEAIRLGEQATQRMIPDILAAMAQSTTEVDTSPPDGKPVRWKSASEAR